jgi:hypothetical protein
MRGALVVVAIAMSACKPVQLVIQGDHRDLRDGAARTRASSPEAPPILVLALDGVSRPLLYDMLRAGKLPNLARLLGGDHFKHAHFDDRFLSTMPSTTMAAWASMFTGVGPAQHGVTGNEYFIREQRTLAAPAPVSFSSIDSTMELYTDDYLNTLIDAPTVYEQLREHDPDALIWIAMSPVYRGADLLLLPGRGVLAKALEGYLAVALEGKESASRDVYAALDLGAIDSVLDRLRQGPPPDVLTLYIYGTDLYAHVAPEGPDRARRDYLRDVIDPALGKLVKRLRKLRRLDRTWVVVTSDHGHTEVVADDEHALGESGDAPEVLGAVGFRPRPFEREVDDDDPYSAVLVYGGALAYVYLADRSRCPNISDACDWQAPPRYKEDVLIAAEAFYHANVRGPAMRGTLDMILVREPRAVDEIDLPFEVYVGDGKTMPLERYLAEHPHPSYVDVAERLRELAVGRHGERAGDILLVARNGDRDRREDRYYFASRYHSWHGSPSRADSEIPLIVANRHHRTAEIRAWIDRVLGAHPYSPRLTSILVGLRGGALGQ